MRLYSIFAIISLLMRNFVLPNPFECFGDTAWLINLIAEPIIHAVAFALVGLVYQRGEAPAIGSILYLITYALLTGILLLFGLFSFAWWWILSLVTVAVGIVLLIRYLSNRFINHYT